MTTPEAQSTTTDPVEPPPPPSSDAPTVSPAMIKHPLFAGFLSLFPGAGNIYNGLYLRGATFFVLAAGSIYMVSERGELWGFVVAFVWIFNVLDAWRQANLINHGYSTDLGIYDEQRPARLGNGGLVGGIVLFAVGAVAALEIYLDLQIDFLFDLWPVYLMALGGWFIYSSRRADPDERADLDERAD